jgi:hypothetical protein
LSGYEPEEEAEEEVIKRLAELRSHLDKKIPETEEELERLRVLMRIVDETVASRSFKRAEIHPRLAQPAEARAAPPRSESIPIKTSSGVLLAELYVEDNIARVVPAEGIALEVSTQPFQAFLISKVMDPMQDRDREMVTSGTLPPDKAFSYEVKTEGSAIKEIIIRNFRDEKRLREIQNSVRWTLDKMYEKTQRRR